LFLVLYGGLIYLALFFLFLICYFLLYVWNLIFLSCVAFGNWCLKLLKLSSDPNRVCEKGCIGTAMNTSINIYDINHRRSNVSFLSIQWRIQDLMCKLSNIKFWGKSDMNNAPNHRRLMRKDTLERPWT
jgi:hypothetical protein